MCSRPTVRRMNVPKIHTSTIGSRLLPHCTLSPATVSDARTSIATMPKFVGLQRCRPSTRIAYFEVIEMAEQSAYGQNAGRSDEDADADARHVGAREVRPLAVERAHEDQFDADRRRDRQERARPALEKAEA